MTLDQLEIGQSAEILHINGKGELRHHLLDMGLTPGTNVTLRKDAPMGDRSRWSFAAYELTIRLSEQEKLKFRKCRNLEQIRTDKS